jgi:hypothetical protein
MIPRKLLTVILPVGIFLSACGGSSENGQDAGNDGGETLCDLTVNVCPESKRCNAEQKCVDAEPLIIETETLPDGRVNFGYNEQIQVGGGLTPYTWTIEQADPDLSFLTLSSHGRLEGTATQQIEDAAITIGVSDNGYAGGEKVTNAYTISFFTCVDGDREVCYTPQTGVCYQGFRTCTDGQMGACVAGSELSSDRRQCGPDCSECDGSIADSCSDGLCTCGTSAVCSGSDRCCEGTCTDVSDSLEHCGSCQNDCAQRIAHASQATPFCSSGVCDYTGDCDRGWLDCDGVRDNGCEQGVLVDTCGACDINCTELVVHVQTSQKICTDTGSEFVCDYSGSCMPDFGDCDQDRSNGCEQHLIDAQHCSACDNDCSLAATGQLCVTPNGAEPYNHVCGCLFDSGSGASDGCDPNNVCCDFECRDATSDPEHCGVCRAECTAGNCTSAACQCAVDDDCPAPSSATTCYNASLCACQHAGDVDTPCPPGEFCCDGASGGSGGPAEEQDLGCCPKTCGQNSVDYPCTQ